MLYVQHYQQRGNRLSEISSFLNVMLHTDNTQNAARYLRIIDERAAAGIVGTTYKQVSIEIFAFLSIRLSLPNI